MSTRSLIGRERADRTVEFSYCHYDGYPEGVGLTLSTHWTDPSKVEALIALGDLSALGSEFGEKHPFDRWKMAPEEKAKVETWCLFYGRDREETDCGPTTVPDRDCYAAANSSTDYQYLLTQEGHWLVHGRRSIDWLRLDDVLAAQKPA